MTILGILVGALAAIVFSAAYFHDFGYKAGLADGYANGHADADAWWSSVAKIIDELANAKEKL